MTRTVNSAFHGTDQASADIGSPMLSLELKEIAQDMHLTYDKITGENSYSAAATINHDGTSGNGALLGVPLVNQFIGRRIAMVAADVATYGGDVFLWAAPVFIPAGESAGGLSVFTVDLHCDSQFETLPSVIVRDSSGAIETTADFVINPYGQGVTPNYTVQGGYLSAQFQVPTDGLKYIFIQMNVASVNQRPFVESVCVRRITGNHSVNFSLDTSVGNEIEFAATTAGGAATSVKTLHDEYFDTEYAVPSFILEKMHYFVCKMYEYVTGAPVIGNSVLTDADSGDVDPATSRYMAHTRSVFSAEPLIDWPMGSDCLGSVKTTGYNTTETTYTSGYAAALWSAPFINATTSADFEFHQISGYCPDFPSASTLKCVVLVSGDGTGASPANFRVELSGGSTVSSSSTTTLGASLMSAYHITGIDFDADAKNIWKFIHTRGTKAYVMNEINIVGVCMYFEP